jgi:hypothetical protein
MPGQRHLKKIPGSNSLLTGALHQNVQVQDYSPDLLSTTAHGG